MPSEHILKLYHGENKLLLTRLWWWCLLCTRTTHI